MQLNDDTTLYSLQSAIIYTDSKLFFQIKFLTFESTYY